MRVFSKASPGIDAKACASELCDVASGWRFGVLPD